MSSVAQIAVEACGQMALGDQRRNRRLRKLVGDLADQPASSLPQACLTWAATIGCYRWLDNEHVAPEAVSRGLRDGTVSRLGAPCRILSVDDTTYADFTAHPATVGLGHLEHPSHAGLLLHTSLAVSLDGVPLGVLGQQSWARDPNELGQKHQRKTRAFDDKESAKWLAAEREMIAGVPAAWSVVSVRDAEGDIYDVLAEPRRAGHDLLVRVAQEQRRVLAATKYLAETVASWTPAGGLVVDLVRADERPARRAKLVVSYGPVEVCPPKHRAGERLAPVRLWAVLAQEVEAPEGQTPVRWLLLSTLPVTSLEEACERLRWYRLRWLVERLHYALKSGCGLERLQLATALRLRRAAAVLTCVAWGVLWVKYEAEVHGEQPCTRLLSEEEWRLLYLRVRRTAPPAEPPTLREAAVMLAQLGGFLARRRDGRPGVKCLWRGIAAFYWLLEGRQAGQLLDSLAGEDHDVYKG